jgi:8-oxo-dGTP diphosphatase
VDHHRPFGRLPLRLTSMDEVVVAGLLRRDRCALLCHRTPDRRNYPNVWDLPGGHVADGETAFEALARELAEELGIAVDAASMHRWRILRAPGVTLQIFLVDRWQGEPANKATDEHDALRWVDQSELEHLELAHPALILPLREALEDR